MEGICSNILTHWLNFCIHMKSINDIIFISLMLQCFIFLISDLIIHYFKRDSCFTSKIHSYFNEDLQKGTNVLKRDGNLPSNNRAGFHLENFY